MAKFLLPRFEAGSKLELMVCARLEKDVGAVKELLALGEDGLERIARYGGAKFPALVRVLVDEGGTHLHVNCTSVGYFDERPRPNCKQAEVFDVISTVIGEELPLVVGGGFEIELEKLPDDDLIRTMARPKTSGELSIRVDSGRITVTKDEDLISQVTWTLRKNGRVRVNTICMVMDEIDVNSLVNAWSVAEENFDLFVMRQASDGED